MASAAVEVLLDTRHIPRPLVATFDIPQLHRPAATCQLLYRWQLAPVLGGQGQGDFHPVAAVEGRDTRSSLHIAARGDHALHHYGVEGGDYPCVVEIGLRTHHRGLGTVQTRRRSIDIGLAEQQFRIRLALQPRTVPLGLRHNRLALFFQ